MQPTEISSLELNVFVRQSAQSDCSLKTLAETEGKQSRTNWEITKEKQAVAVGER